MMTSEELAGRFTMDVSGHKMQVLHDDGLYRHLRFQEPGNYSLWFELVTWPGALTFNGAMGTFTFASVQDMFIFFRKRAGEGSVHPGSLAETVLAGSGMKEYSEDLFHLVTKERSAERAVALKSETRKRARLDAGPSGALPEEDIAFEEGARASLTAFEYDGLQFVNTWEWDLEYFSPRFLWCCWAIRWGITQFDQAAGAVPGGETPKP